jgi:putative DNA primase/helicase
MLASELSELTTFYSLLYPLTRGWVEVRAFSRFGRAGERSFVPASDPVAVAQTVLRLAPRFAVYSGVCTRTDEAARERRGTRESLEDLTAFWADIDVKRFDSIFTAYHALEQFPLEPSIVVRTGHGYHAYWLLTEPVSLPGADKARLEQALKTLQVDVLGTDNVSDLPRVMRAPSTWNRKDEGHPVRTAIVCMDDDVRYDLDRLLAVLPESREMRRERDPGSGLVEGRYAGLELVLASDFVAYCRELAETLSEPLWYAMITNLIGFRGGRAAIHDLSRPHPGYSYADTEWKIGHALSDAPGPHSYRYIAEYGFVSEDLADPRLISPASRAFVHRERGETG